MAKEKADDQNQASAWNEAGLPSNLKNSLVAKVALVTGGFDTSFATNA